MTDFFGKQANKRPWKFNSSKFLSLPFHSQHKKCAELLRLIYEKISSKEDSSSLFSLYLSFLEWMQLPRSSLDIIDSLEKVSHLYHFHLKQANIHIKEHHLLNQMRTGDRTHNTKILDIDIYLDHIRSAHNVGSIIRTTEAFSLGTLYFSENTPFIDHPQVQNTSMNSYHWVPCLQGFFLDKLRRPIVLLETFEEATPLYEFIFPPSFTLVIGNEEFGCSETAAQLADFIVEIPLFGRKNSLNVANAFAIAASEIIRQKIHLIKKDH